MKKGSRKMRLLNLIILTLCLTFLFSATSCLVLVRKDNGKHRGWFKNSNSHPRHTKPGKAKGNHEESTSKLWEEMDKNLIVHNIKK